MGITPGVKSRWQIGRAISVPTVRCGLWQQGNSQRGVNYFSNPSFVIIETFSPLRQR